MTEVERIREVVVGSIAAEDLQRRRSEGWKLVALEWERERSEPVAPASAAAADVPFGLRVAADCQHLEENPAEREVLLAMMELTVQDGPYSGIAEELNRRGHRTRDGAPWTPVLVFQMLPRLIEAGPNILHSDDWEERRKRIRYSAP